MTRNSMMAQTHSLSEDFASGVFDAQKTPRLSLYQPTHRHHPENRQDPIRFQNLVGVMERTLGGDLQKREVEALIRPFRELAAREEFWNGTREGIAALAAPGFFRVYLLPRPVPERVVVGESFHTKPLLRVLQSADRYQILGLSRDGVRLFEGNRDGLDEVELAPGVPRNLAGALGEQYTEPVGGRHGHRSAGTGVAVHHGQGTKKDELDVDTERFFRAVDRTVYDSHSRPTGLPLLLAALAEHQSTFHRLSRNPSLLPERLVVDPGAVSLEELRERAWKVVLPRYTARLLGLCERFGTARANGQGASDVSEVAHAAVAGRVRTLLVDGDRYIPGTLDRNSGEVVIGSRDEAGLDDLPDDIAELVLAKGGEVVVVPTEQMPVDTGLAAIFFH